MDSIRPLLRVAVVIASLSLMIGYVWYAGGRPSRGWSAPVPATPPTTAPAGTFSGTFNGTVTLSPGTLIYGSKSGAIAVPPGTLLPGSKSSMGTTLVSDGVLKFNSPTTQPTMIFSTSKSIILQPIAPPVLTPATQPAGR